MHKREACTGGEKWFFGLITQISKKLVLDCAAMDLPKLLKFASRRRPNMYTRQVCGMRKGTGGRELNCVHGESFRKKGPCHSVEF